MQGLKINKTTYNIYKYAAVLSCAVILLLGVTFLQPLSLQNNSYAEEANLDMSVTLDPTITIWTTDANDNASSQVNIAATPDESVATGTIRAHVSTNNLTGYNLTIQSQSTDAKMIHENEDVSATINPLTGSGTSKTSWAGNSDLNNMWGYSIGNNDSYLGVPGSSSDEATIDTTEEPNNDNHIDVTFAAKADLSLPAGTYTDTVIFSAVANAIPETRTLDDFEYMQDVDADSTAADICENSTEWTSSNNKEYTLKDKRDSNTYIIRKLADKHCWMVTNLRLGKTSDMELTSSNTDITDSTWSLPASISSGFNSYTTAQMHIGSTSDNANWTTSWGNYYNWTAATAGQGTNSTTRGNINVSICPKGWKLPKGEANTVDYSWAKLYNAYSSNVSNFQTATNTGSSYWSGNYRSGSLLNADTNGYWWSRMAVGANYAYNLYATSGSVNPQVNSNKYDGFSVRCVLSNE